MTWQPRRNPWVSLAVGPFLWHPLVRILNGLETEPVSHIDPLLVQHIVWIFRAFTAAACLPKNEMKILENPSSGCTALVAYAPTFEFSRWICIHLIIFIWYKCMRAVRGPCVVPAYMYVLRAELPNDKFAKLFLSEHFAVKFEYSHARELQPRPRDKRRVQSTVQRTTVSF